MALPMDEAQALAPPVSLVMGGFRARPTMVMTAVPQILMQMAQAAEGDMGKPSASLMAVMVDVQRLSSIRNQLSLLHFQMLHGQKLTILQVWARRVFSSQWGMKKLLLGVQGKR